ncbi:MAG: hypothetical protein ACOX63_05010 [Christensenellales bacterium]
MITCGSRKRALVAFCAVLIMALMLPAWAEQGEESEKWGYFERSVYLRENPVAGDRVLMTIYRRTPLHATEINKGWGLVTHLGKTGYVHLKDMLPLPEVTDSEPQLLYTVDTRYMRAYPLEQAEVLLRVPAETPVTVDGKSRQFARAHCQRPNRLLAAKRSA